MTHEHSRRGCFISFEGGEGAGKSTQLELLSEALARAGISHIRTREPGGSGGAEAIRALIVQGDANRWDAVTETLLLMAARHHHIQEVISPALSTGTWVLCDRFYDSTRVYQGIAKNVSSEWITQCHHLIFGNLMPDLTLYFDIDAKVGLERTLTRRGSETRFESMPVAFHEKLRHGFLSLAAAESSRIYTIDAAQSLESVQMDVLNTINQQLGTQLVLS